MNVLVTGASGFIGRSLCLRLKLAGHKVFACSRRPVSNPGTLCISSPELGPEADWTAALRHVDAVVHLAGMVYVDIAGGYSHAEALYQRINTEATRSLARQIVRTDVKQFVFVSSVHAVASSSDDAITDSTLPRPSSAYGRSKLAAEQAIKQELAMSSCAWTILRPPMVYGPGNTANFESLLKLVKTGVPLPLRSVRNRRSFLYVENLADVIAACLSNTKAFGRTFLVSDGEDVSTPELIRAIVSANEAALSPFRTNSASERKASLISIGGSCPSRFTECRSQLFSFPEGVLKLVGYLPGLGAVQKLTSSLYVDSETVRSSLNWSPPFTMDEAMLHTLMATNTK